LRVVFKAQRLVYHSTLGWRVKKEKELRVEGWGLRVEAPLLLLARIEDRDVELCCGLGFRVWGSGFGVGDLGLGLRVEGLWSILEG